MNTFNYYDNSYLNTISNPLDTMTISKFDTYSAFVDKSIPSITLDETEFNVRQIILKDLIIKILNIGKDYRSTTFLILNLIIYVLLKNIMFVVIF